MKRLYHLKATAFCVLLSALLMVAAASSLNAKAEIILNPIEKTYSSVTTPSINRLTLLFDGGFIDMAAQRPVYMFYIKDHLGSNRVVATSSGALVQTNSYYPYGASFTPNPTTFSGTIPGRGDDIEPGELGGDDLIPGIGSGEIGGDDLIPGIGGGVDKPRPGHDVIDDESVYKPSTVAMSQRWRFAGNEIITLGDLNIYDFSARHYDPTTARFTTMDPLAEKYCGISPYAYCAGNPVVLVDPDGKRPRISKDRIKRECTIEQFFYIDDNKSDIRAKDKYSYIKMINNACNAFNRLKPTVEIDGEKYSVRFDFRFSERPNMQNDKKSTSIIIHHIPDTDQKHVNGTGCPEKIKLNNRTINGTSILSNKDNIEKATMTLIHEMGHTVLMEHKEEGIMTATSTDPKRGWYFTQENYDEMIEGLLKYYK